VEGEHRAFVAPRLALSDDGMLRATTRSGLTSDARALAPTPKRGGAGLALALALGLVVVAGSGVVGYRTLTKQPEPPPSADLPKVDSAPLVSSRARVEVPVVKRFSVSIVPPGAEVTVDGSRAETKDGRLEVEGTIGSIRDVKLSYQGKIEQYVVAIAETGAVPAKLDLGVKQVDRPEAPVKGSAPKGGTGTRGGEVSKPPEPKPAEPKAPPRKDPDVNRNVDEFGK
jgi:hypothetical protein